MVGGTEGFSSFKGFIGHMRIYRRHALTPEQVGNSGQLLFCVLMFIV